MDVADSDEARPAPVRDGCTRVRGRRRLLQRAARIARYEQAGPGFVRFGEYRRVLETVWLDSGEAQQCWMYRYNRNSGRRPVVKRLAAGCKPDLFAWRQSSR